MSNLSAEIQDVLGGVDAAELLNKSDSPVWKGPSSNGRNGGITFSLLNKYLVCKERFRLRTMYGLVARERFKKEMEYGNMWHLCEDIYSRYPELHTEKFPYGPWLGELSAYCEGLKNKYPFSQEEINWWYNVCKVQFPIYLQHWRNVDTHNRYIPYLSECEFNIKYPLPSGRYVYLRGKWDGVDLQSSLGDDLTWLRERKSKGDPDIQRIEKQLTLDMQTMIYLTALKVSGKVQGDIAGVIYDVIRRPLSGGVGTIRQHKASGKKPAETTEQFFNRLKGLIDGTGEDAPGPRHYFTRFESRVSDFEIESFREQCLDPILDNLIDDWEWYQCTFNTDNSSMFVFSHDVRKEKFPHHVPRQYLMPFGLYNPLSEDGSTEYDEYIMNGNNALLTTTDNLFPELANNA